MFVFFLYVYDAIQMVYANDVLIIYKSGTWTYKLDRGHFLILGKKFYIPNLISFGDFAYCLQWDNLEVPISNNKISFSDIQNSLYGVQICAYFTAFLLLILMPIALFVIKIELLSVIILALIYISCIGMSFLIFMQKSKLRFSGGEFFYLSLELILCPPFALNVVRKINCHINKKETSINVAKALLSRSQFTQLCEEIIDLVDCQINSEIDDHEEIARLTKVRNSISAELSL